MKNKVITIVFVIYIFTFSILGIIIKDKEISFSERRKLQTFPSYELNGEYINKVDKYFLDHFPLRDTFREIKASFNYNVLHKLDNNGIYIQDNYIFKSEYPTNVDSIDRFFEYVNGVKENFDDNDIYVMIIPDKNYYLESNNFLHIDYDYIYNEIDRINAKNIDIRDVLTLHDYYETDTHWKQENLDKVLVKMNEIMNFSYYKQNYYKNEYYDFYGVYYGESAVNRKAERLTYLTNSNINSLYADYLENDSLHSVYNVSKLESVDSYEVYLDGASSFIEIYNYNSKNDKELIIFRDSFGSSLGVLLANYYKKVTLIDNRYITSANYLNLFEIEDQDVLFMYSTLLVNNSGSLKK